MITSWVDGAASPEAGYQQALKAMVAVRPDYRIIQGFDWAKYGLAMCSESDDLYSLERMYASGSKKIQDKDVFTIDEGICCLHDFMSSTYGINPEAEHVKRCLGFPSAQRSSSHLSAAIMPFSSGVNLVSGVSAHTAFEVMRQAAKDKVDNLKVVSYGLPPNGMHVPYDVLPVPDATPGKTVADLIRIFEANELWPY